MGAECIQCRLSCQVVLNMGGAEHWAVLNLVPLNSLVLDRILERR